jgi:lincosamide nucleotidyltransferase A/C/D/E
MAAVKSETTAADVTGFYLRMEALGVEVWLDGGWGVDALLGEQTRQHGDMDIVVRESDLGRLLDFLKEQGFRELARDDSRPWNFALGDASCREIDLHVIVLDSEGNGIYGPPDHGEMYPAEALQGRGHVAGLPVRCISPEFQIASHRGYEFDETDVGDVCALADKFGLDIPREYRERLRKL